MNMIEVFPLDYMHLILLGVVKKLILFFVKTSRTNFKTKFSANDILNVSEKLLACGKTIPKEINRSVRSLDVLSFWKATEFRTFLLKTGPFVLKDKLPVDAFNHFLALHCAITICSSNSFKKFIPVAEKLIEEFVKKFADIYGEENCMYNFHSLIHLVSDVKR